MKRHSLTIFLCLLLVSSLLLAAVMQHVIGMQQFRAMRTVSSNAPQRDPLTIKDNDRLSTDNLSEQKSLDRLNINYDPQKIDPGLQLAGGSYLNEENDAREPVS